MKAGYRKPVMEFEEYELNTAIAAGCSQIITLGPGDMDHDPCAEYPQPLSLELESIEAVTANFYSESGNCSCYLSSGDGTLLTS